MKVILGMVMAVALLGCGAVAAGSNNVWFKKQYDPEFGVVCYGTAGGALSCVRAK